MLFDKIIKRLFGDFKGGEGCKKKLAQINYSNYSILSEREKVQF
jgi:hypothetical protein